LETDTLKVQTPGSIEAFKLIKRGEPKGRGELPDCSPPNPPKSKFKNRNFVDKMILKVSGDLPFS
jgi:hypothetical protein